MKFSINKKDFLDLLLKTQSIVEKRNTMQVLSNVCLTVKDNGLFVNATDLEVSLRVYTDKIHNTSDGTITIYAKNLIDIVREFPDTVIQFNVLSNQWSQISAGKIKFQIVSLPSDKFPILVIDPEKSWKQISKDVILNVINKCSFSMSMDETRYFLNGIYFDVTEENYLTTAAMDGYRLALYRQEFTDVKNTFKRSFIIPRKGISEIKKLIESSDKDPFISLDESSFWIRLENVDLSVRLIENDFPDYSAIIPTKFDKKVYVDVEPFSSAIKRVSLLANERSKDIKLSFDSHKLIISTNNPDIGDASEEIPIVYEGSTVDIRFNSRYILEAISVISEPFVEICITDKLGPALIRAKNCNKYKAIVMPMRL